MILMDCLFYNNIVLSSENILFSTIYYSINERYALVLDSIFKVTRPLLILNGNRITHILMRIEIKVEHAFQ